MSSLATVEHLGKPVACIEQAGRFHPIATLTQAAGHSAGGTWKREALYDA